MKGAAQERGLNLTKTFLLAPYEYEADPAHTTDNMSESRGGGEHPTFGSQYDMLSNVPIALFIAGLAAGSIIH